MGEDARWRILTHSISDGATVWRNARLATLPARRASASSTTARRGRDGRIVYAGPDADLPAERRGRAASTATAAGSRPASIDCHTHLVYAGDRAHEFELRLAGATYEEIARAGGGIVSTVEATRAAERGRAGRAAALPRLDALIAEGVTTVEVKSGYGLDLDNELQDAARRAPPGRRAAGHGAHHLPRRARPAAGVRRATRTPTSTSSCARCCPPSPRRAWPTRWTPSARASRSRPRRPRACSRRRARWACR